VDNIIMTLDKGSYIVAVHGAWPLWKFVQEENVCN